MPQFHARRTKQGRAVWYIERLWELTHDLPIKQIPITSIQEFEVNCWFVHGQEPSCLAIARHAKRIWEADLRYPIILGATGIMMDGLHRVAKAWILGQATVDAVQFVEDPPPDYIEPLVLGDVPTFVR